jgi:group I intron endonuclease
MKKIGIYKIENVVNNKYYIGSSNDIDIRWTAHKRAKEKGNLLHRSIKKHGIQDFYFEVLEECAEADLLNIEQQYLDIAFLMPHMIYNTNPLAACPPNGKRGKYSAEHCANISAAKKGKKLGKQSKERSAEHCAKISAAKTGKKQSAEHCAKKSAANKDYTIYSFNNINTGEVFTGIQYDFYTKYNLNIGNVNALIKGKIKSVKGWVLI